MLVKVSKSEVYVPRLHGDTTPGVRLVSIDGTERRVSIEGEKGGLTSEPNRALFIRAANGLALVRPEENFAITAFSEFLGDVSEVAWTSYVAGFFVDTKNLRYKKFEIDRDSLNVDDPGYSGPSGFVLIPDSLDILVTMARDHALRVVNANRKTVGSIELPSPGSSNPQVDEGSVVFSNYDTLCSYDPVTMKLKTSPKLQPSILLPEYGIKSRAFIGVPHKSSILNGWLVPRPYSSDILFVESESLIPTGVIKCGGKPHSLVEFEDGSLLIIDHPFDKFQAANISDLSTI